mmetsp:Transcript_58611/g.126009  ORF Transcript_58611/g.126009 Transcript_58611/m.126009 type:complete len:226 (-) Transcript_58611:112-789(-)
MHPSSFRMCFPDRGSLTQRKPSINSSMEMRPSPSTSRKVKISSRSLTEMRTIFMSFDISLGSRSTVSNSSLSTDPDLSASTRLNIARKAFCGPLRRSSSFCRFSRSWPSRIATMFSETTPVMMDNRVQPVKMAKPTKTGVSQGMRSSSGANNFKLHPLMISNNVYIEAKMDENIARVSGGIFRLSSSDRINPWPIMRVAMMDMTYRNIIVITRTQNIPCNASRIP